MVENTSKWGRETAAKRYAKGGRVIPLPISEDYKGQKALSELIAEEYQRFAPENKAPVIKIPTPTPRKSSGGKVK